VAPQPTTPAASSPPITPVIEKAQPAAAPAPEVSLKRAAPSSPLVKEDKKQRLALQKSQLVASKDHHSSSSSTAPATSHGEHAVDSARPIKVPARKKKQPEHEKPKEETVPEALAPITPSLLSMEEVISLTGESEWSAKTTGFENLHKKLETAHQEVGAKQIKILDLLVESMSEKHFKVLQAVLDCVLSFTKHFPEAVRPTAVLQKVVVSSLNVLTDPSLQAKKGVLAAAENILKVLTFCFFLLAVWRGRESCLTKTWGCF